MIVHCADCDIYEFAITVNHLAVAEASLGWSCVSVTLSVCLSVCLSTL